MNSETVLSFEDSRSAGLWSPLTDQVRGGKSTAFIQFRSDGTAQISGNLTLIDNAGFASYRATQTSGADWDFTGRTNLVVQAGGDGRVYKILLKDKDATIAAFDYSWESELPTEASGAIQTTRLAFSSFVATYRGRPITNVPPMDLSQITQIGIQLNDKIAGPFSFRLKSIEVES